MKWIAFILAAFVIAIIIILVGVVKIFPRYAPGEASAMVKVAYTSYSASQMTEEYLGHGVWKVTGKPGPSRGAIPPTISLDAISYFKIYEQTDTIEIVRETGPPPVGITSTPKPIPGYLWLVIIGGAIVVILHLVFGIRYWRKKRRVSTAGK